MLANGNVIGLLDQAYGLLSSADHDYKGHRMHAMRCIKAAARELGVTLSGEGKGGGNQESSDSQLRSAQSLLQQAVTGLAGKPLRHVSEAITAIEHRLEHKINGRLPPVRFNLFSTGRLETRAGRREYCRLPLSRSKPGFAFLFCAFG